MGSTWKLSVTTSEGDCKYLELMVRHTVATTYINNCYDIFQTNKEAYQSCSNVCTSYDKASTFYKDCINELTHRQTQLLTTTTDRQHS